MFCRVLNMPLIVYTCFLTSIYLLFVLTYRNNHAGLNKVRNYIFILVLASILTSFLYEYVVQTWKRRDHYVDFQMSCLS